MMALVLHANSCPFNHNVLSVPMTLFGGEGPRVELMMLALKVLPSPHLELEASAVAVHPQQVAMLDM